MNTKINLSFIITLATLTTGICFCLGFFDIAFKSNFADFFLYYIIATVVISAPMFVTNIFMLRDNKEDLAPHQLLSKYAYTQKFVSLAVLIITISILMIIILGLKTSYTFMVSVRYFDGDQSMDNSFYYLVFVALIVILFIVVKITSEGFINRLLKASLLFGFMSIFVILGLAIYHGTLHDFKIFWTLSHKYSIKLFYYASLYACVTNLSFMLIIRNIFKINKNSDIDKIKIKRDIILTYLITFILILILSVSFYILTYTGNILFTCKIGNDLVYLASSCYNPIAFLMINLMFIFFAVAILILLVNHMYSIFKSNPKYIGASIIVVLFFAITYYMMIGNYLFLSFRTAFFVHQYIFLTVIVECLIFGWIFDAQKITYLIQKQDGTKVSPLYNIFIRLITPVFITMVVITQFIINFGIIVYLGTIIITFIIVILLGIALHKTYSQKTF